MAALELCLVVIMSGGSNRMTFSPGQGDQQPGFERPRMNGAASPFQLDPPHEADAAHLLDLRMRQQVTEQIRQVLALGRARRPGTPARRCGSRTASATVLTSGPPPNVVA